MKKTKHMKTQFTILAIVVLLFYQCADSTPPSTGYSTPIPLEGTEVTAPKMPEANKVTHTLRTVHFINDTVGFIGGGNAVEAVSAVIFKTTDGGVSWTGKHKEDGYYITKVISLPDNPDILFATTTRNFILKSVDKGETWTESNGPTNSFNMLDIAFIDDQNGFIAGSTHMGKGVLFKTNDAGATWTEAIDPESEESGMLEGNALMGIATITDNDKKTILISGGSWSRGTVLKSDDAGQSWKLITISNRAQLTGIAANSTVVFAVGNNGRSGSHAYGEMFKSTDFGESWKHVSTGYNNKLRQINLLGDKVCTVGVSRHDDTNNPELIILSINGGKKWQRLSHAHKTATWEDVSFISDTAMMTVGYEGKTVLLKWVSETEETEESEKEE